MYGATGIRWHDHATVGFESLHVVMWDVAQVTWKQTIWHHCFICYHDAANLSLFKHLSVLISIF